MGKHQTSISHSSRGWKSEIKALADGVSPSLVTEGQALPVSSPRKGALQGLLNKGASPIYEASPLMT